MTQWEKRSTEERALFNPSFISLLLWHSATGYYSVTNSDGLPLCLSFLIPPMVLHQETRELLPKKINTSMPIWLKENPIIRLRMSERAQIMVPYTKEALLFGGMYKLLVFNSEAILPDQTWKSKIREESISTNDEIRLCVTRANFLGRWFAKIGNPMTIMMLMGVRP